MSGLVYILKNKINGKIYVGQTIQRFEQRLRQHLFAADSNSKQLIHKAFRKYGIDNFSIEIIN